MRSTPFLPMIWGALIVILLFFCAHGIQSLLTRSSLSSSASTDPALFVAPAAARPPEVFRQVGLATRLNGEGPVMPLMGKRAPTRSGYWYYHCLSPEGLMLPVLVQNKQAMDSSGVPELSTGDSIFVEAYDAAYGVNMYATSAEILTSPVYSPSI